MVRISKTPFMPTSRRAPPMPARKVMVQLLVIQPCSSFSIFYQSRVYLKGRIFPTKGRARLVDIECQRASGVDHPVVEGVLSGAEVQPYIHDINVKVQHESRIHLFTVFCKNHCALPVNPAVRNIRDDWKGDILVMRRGQKTPYRYVNLQSGDRRLVQRVMEA